MILGLVVSRSFDEVLYFVNDLELFLGVLGVLGGLGGSAYLFRS
jgi:hypothetical protein